MGLIREPKNIDFTVNSKPWTEDELQDFREIMNKLKAKPRKRTIRKKPKATAQTSRPEKRNSSKDAMSIFMP